jgi:hypothetical protein
MPIYIFSKNYQTKWFITCDLSKRHYEILTSTLAFWTAHFCVHTCPQATLVLWEKKTRNGIYMCGQKDKICVGLVNLCEYLFHKWPRICRNHNPFLHSWFCRVCNKSTTMGVTSGTGTAYPKEAHEFTSGFCEIHVAQSSFLCSVLWIIICPLAFGHYMVCFSTNGLWVVLRYLKLFLLSSYCIYVCIGCYFTL